MSRRRGIAVAAVAAVMVPLGATGGTVSAAAPIRGSGSTFAEVALDAWAADVYVEQALSVDYSGTGSLSGLTTFESGLTDFAATDVPYPAGQGTGREYAYVPIVAGGTALPYNLVDPTGQRITSLKLSAETIAGLFFGAITNWRDPTILAENPTLVDRIPNWEVRLAVRSGGSGTTATLTDFLSTTVPDAWQAFLASSGAEADAGENYLTTWPDNCSCARFAGSAELANFVAQSSSGSQGTIGYVETAYALQLGLPVARVENTAGYFRLPDARSVAVALLEAAENGDGTQNLEGVHTSTREEAYPISSYNYLVIPTGDDFPEEKGETLSQYLIYSVTLGQDKAADIGYSPLPPNLVQFALNRVAEINGHVPAPPLGDWGRAYERLAPDVLEPPPTGVYVAQYADATFARRGTELRVAPGQIDDNGVAGEELEIDLTETTCSARTLTTTTVSARLAAPEIEGVEVAARAGAAEVFGTYMLTGARTTVPAGRNCAAPVAGAEVTVPVEFPVTLDVGWRNERGSVPEVYSGTDCGGDGVCYSRDAKARATWSTSAGSRQGSSTSGFFFEGTYTIAEVASSGG